MVKLDLDLYPDLDPDPHSEKLLGPDQHKMSADPQPCPARLSSVLQTSNTENQPNSWQLAAGVIEALNADPNLLSQQESVV